MTNFIIVVRTRRGFRKTCIRGFVRSLPVSVNPENGRDLDRSADIADAYHGDKNALNTYFRDKEASIRRDYREDSNSGAIHGVTASELQSWQENRDDLLEQLEEQKDDVFELASVSYSSSESEDNSESEDLSDNEGNSVDENISSNNNTSSTSNGTTETSNVNAVESVSDNSSYHRQDSSDVVQTDYSSFEPFDD